MRAFLDRPAYKEDLEPAFRLLSGSMMETRISYAEFGRL